MSRRGERQVPVQMQEDIRKLRSQGWTYPKLADHFELSRITVRNVVRREQAYSDCPRETSEKTRAKIQQLYREEGLTYSALAKRFSLGQPSRVTAPTNNQVNYSGPDKERTNK